MYANGSISDKAEELRKQRSKTATEVRLSDRYRVNFVTNGLEFVYAKDDQSSREESNMTIKNVYFNDPVTVVLWADGTKTLVKCQDGDLYSKESGLAIAIAKKALGNKGNFNEVFKKWIPEYNQSNLQSLKNNWHPAGHIVMKDGSKVDIYEIERPEKNRLEMTTQNDRYCAVMFGDYNDYYKFDPKTKSWKETDDIAYVVAFR
jgi:hypothetical protein